MAAVGSGTVWDGDGQHQARNGTECGLRRIMDGCEVSGSHATHAVGAEPARKRESYLLLLARRATTPQLQLCPDSTSGHRPQT